MNLKSVLITGLCIMLASTGCRQDAEELRIGKSEVRLHAEETVKVGSNISAQWSSDNDFIASVDSEGNITGHHVGRTRVVAAAGDDRRECLVEVVPRYDTYIEPAYELLGKETSFAEIEKLEIREVFSKNEGVVLYKGDRPYIQSVQYLWAINNPKLLESIKVTVNVESKEEVKKFLAERYLTINGDSTLFIDNFESKARIGIRLNNVNAETFRASYETLKPAN